MSSFNAFNLKTFPIPMDRYKPVPLHPDNKKLTPEQRKQLQDNVRLLRDVLVFFTSTGAARGVSGHTGGPYDTVPEVVILLSLFAGQKEGKKEYVETLFDEAGHRVATQYLLSAMNGDIPFDHLLHYRQANSKLPGHPELGLTPGVKFSSGRLGHMWPLVNGVALANRDKTVFLLGSDGSQQEGNDAEAARLAVAKKLNIKLLIDDNDVTISGHPSQYLEGFHVAQTLEGHGLKVFRADGEDIDELYEAIVKSISYKGPAAVVSKRVMCPGIPELEGSHGGHDVVSVDTAVKYLTERGYHDCVKLLKEIHPSSVPYLFEGSTRDKGANRSVFGEAVNGVLDRFSKEENAARVMVIDSDLEGSTGLKAIHSKHPEVFEPSGVMERGNFSAAAGYGSFHEKGKEKFGVFSTFSAFLEMTISEITMARLNFSNVLCHFSHSGVDEMADNTCHFGLNNLFADNGLVDGYETRLYFPADPAQMVAVIERVFFEHGLRFVFSTRSKVPWILKEGSEERLYGGDYKFQPAKDEIVRHGKDGWVISFGDMLYRSLDAIERLKREGFDVGLINKSTLNIVDEDAIKMYGSSEFVVVVESLNQRTGLGSKMGTWLLERGLTPKYGYMGSTKEGCGGLGEQIPFQGLDPQSIITKVRDVST